MKGKKPTHGLEHRRLRPMKIPPFRCAANHDPSGRRGIWFRRVATNPLTLDIIGGREGDDYECTLQEGTPIPSGPLIALMGLLNTSANMLEESQKAEKEERKRAAIKKGLGKGKHLIQ